MARTSIKPIQIPEGVTLTFEQSSIVAVGKLGEMSLTLHQDVDLIKDDGSIAFPIHDDSELELFHKLFQDTDEHLILDIEETIFVPNETMNVHEH